MLIYKGIPIKETIVRKDWIKLKKCFIDTWENRASENITLLAVWLGAWSPMERLEVDKLVLVYNYLTEEVKVKHTMIDILVNKIEVELNRRFK